MWFLIKRKRKTKLSREQAKRAIPVVNPLVEATTGKRGELVIKVPLRKDWLGKILRFLFNLPKDKQVALDEVGETVFRLCDGRNTIDEIIDKVAARYKLGKREAQLALSTYLQHLLKRRIIGLQVPKE